MTAAANGGSMTLRIVAVTTSSKGRLEAIELVRLQAKSAHSFLQI